MAIDNKNHEFYKYAAKAIQELLEQNLSYLDLESRNAIQHFISHDEYEMAFEGLFIDLMTSGKISSRKNLSGYIELGKRLGLDENTVFEVDFWERFIAFLSHRI